MNPTEQELVNKKELKKLEKLAGKSLLILMIGSIFTGGIGGYFYCGKWTRIISAFFISCLIGCVLVTPERQCQTINQDGYYEEFCGSYWNIENIAPFFLFIALIDNANAITSARVKLKKLQQQENLPESVEAFQLTLMKLIDDRGEATVSELVIITGYSVTVIRSVLATLEKEEIVCVGNREDGSIVYRLI